MPVQVKNFEISQLNDGRWMLTWASAEEPSTPSGQVQWNLDGQRLTLSAASESPPWHFEPLLPEACAQLRQAAHQAMVFATLDSEGRPVAGGAANASSPLPARRFGR